MGDKSPKSKQRDKQQKDAGKEKGKREKEKWQQAHTQVPAKAKT